MATSKLIAVRYSDKPGDIDLLSPEVIALAKRLQAQQAGDASLAPAPIADEDAAFVALARQAAPEDASEAEIAQLAQALAGGATEDAALAQLQANRAAAAPTTIPPAPALKPLSPAAPRPARVSRSTLAIVACGLLLAVALVALAGLGRSAPQPRALPTEAPLATAPAPTSAPAAVAPTTPPTATPDPQACAIIAPAPTFFAPAGAATGDAAAGGTACRLIAWHSGLPAWRQVSIAGSAPVWVEARFLDRQETAGLPDLAPPPTAIPAPPPAVPPQQPAPEPTVRPLYPSPTPAPPTPVEGAKPAPARPTARPAHTSQPSEGIHTGGLK